MRDFYQQRFNLLLCSTIIETGIDVPTANTIIIHRADRFGLAQLHQLRGRVGRSHHQAYAYLLTPPEEALSAQAKKRLEAIQMMEDLGSGFYLAMHDLEIRGAGEVLGDSQSGEMQEIGFQLYADMLQGRGRRAQGGPRARPVRAARRHHRDQPARAGAAAGDLLQRRARAAGPLQAPRQLRHAGRARGDAGGTGRPLRPAARAGAGAARVPPPAPDRAGRSASPRSTPGRSARTCSSAAAAVRPRQADPAGAAGRALSASPARIACASSAPRRRSPTASRWSGISSDADRLARRLWRSAAAAARVRPRLAFVEQHRCSRAATATC